MRVRSLSVLAAAVLLVLGAIPASASSEGHSYLALGDSVPFGFNPNPALWSNISNFTGWPEIVAKTLNIEDVNAACPGESTGGFMSLTATDDNGCRPFRSAFPLHVTYKTSQLAFATSYLRSHPRTRLVTLMLGANDVFHLQHVCQAKGGTPVEIAACVGLGLVTLLPQIQANLSEIFGALRATGYDGLIVAETYYALDYSDTSGAVILNTTMIGAANANGVLVASGLDAWRATANGGSSCTAGLLLPAFPPTSPGCDVHPSPLGRDLLAKAVVDTIAASCPAADPIGCLNRNRG